MASDPPGTDTSRLAAIAAAARELDNAFHGLRPPGLTDRQALALDRLGRVLRGPPPATAEESPCSDC